jgi:hypothetical protein
MKKYAPYILIILFILVGLFGSAVKVRAQSADGTGTCSKPNPSDPSVYLATSLNQTQCGLNPTFKWVATGATDASAPITAYQNCINTGGTADSCKNLSGATPPTQSAFQKALDAKGCGFGIWSDTSMGGCMVQIAYPLFYQLPAFLLAKVAYFFNVLISVTLNGDVFKQDFVPKAWAVVRDLSNIFFILVLLYIAIKIILDIGAGDSKKMIIRVIIMALLINFSMFFTQVVIDTSNVVALIFYNKVSVTTKDQQTGQSITRPYDSVNGEKDVAGGMVSAFDPTTPLKQSFFDESKKIYINGVYQPGADAPNVPTATLLGLILISGLIMGFAIYALFISGLSFLGRLLELWVLIIFSPFALMSSTVPKLSGIDYLGWDSWFKRLISAAFMAPIFMFCLYFIFMLIGSNIFTQIVKPAAVGTNDAAGTIKMLLAVVMPAIFICLLLLQATKFAKKGSGVFGEVITKFGGAVGALAVGVAGGAAIGGVAALGRASAGRMGAAASNSKWAQKWESKGFGGEYFRRATGAVGAASFDARAAKIGGKTLAGATGLDLGEAQKGGFTARRKADVERRQKRADELKVREDDPMKQKLNSSEADLQGLMNRLAKDFEVIDKDLETQRQAKNDAGKDSPEEKAAIWNIKELNAQKTALRTGQIYDGKMINSDGTTKNVHADGTSYKVAGGANDGSTIKKLQTEIIPTQKNDILTENRNMLRTYANTTESGLGRIKDFIFSGGQSSYKGAREAAHKIRMETKIETKAS